MGFYKRDDILFLNVSCGFLVNKKKEIQESAYTGKLINIKKVEDVYEDQPVEKVSLLMKDSENMVVNIKFSLEGWYSVGFFQRIGKVNFDHEFTLGVMQSDKNPKMSFCWMKQGDVKCEKAEIPVPIKVKVGNKEIYDYSKFVEFAHVEINTIQEKLKAKVVETESIEPTIDGEPLPF